MNTKNLEYLNKQVFYTGFGQELAKELEEKIAGETPSFSIDNQKLYGNDEANIKLHFQKSNKSELYFFTHYDYQLKQGHKPEEVLRQTFYIGKENNITAKEAYNLMSGRAIYKQWTKMEMEEQDNKQRLRPTKEKFGAWLQLDFDNKDERGNFKAMRYFDSYNFDLEKTLSALPLKAMQNPAEKQQLIDALQKGNRQKVLIEDHGEQHIRYIQASPKFKNIDFYDENMKKVIYRQPHQQAVMVNEQELKKPEIKEEKEIKQDGTKRRNRKGVSL